MVMTDIPDLDIGPFFPDQIQSINIWY